VKCKFEEMGGARGNFKAVLFWKALLAEGIKKLRVKNGTRILN
jgi:hypothetical protein